ncbi:integrase arm-type DNA-binding domain-containing protein [uncultured Pseudacidovorax sp.]|uniref:tyrosine-type recombinase/integrase n=1 Tax=uncultured Pseudacidovorax sp. TaxID=679313 RepID=UPI0025D4A9CD|nr:integrase arm-type DNA-binding domain-containing protein [uncultured Pseudacidovorax sp.]
MGLLSETQIKATKPGPKESFLNDGDNLFLRVRSSGKAWIYRYDKDGKTVKLGLGSYPAVTLPQARSKAYEASSLRASGQDLKEVRRQREEQERVAALNTFALLAGAWVASAKKDRQWSSGYADKVIRHLEIHVFPWVGNRAIEKIAPTEIVRCLHRIKDRGNLETAQRVREAVQHVYQYAVDVGALEPAGNFVNKNTGGLPAPRSRHYAAITDPVQLGRLLRDIRSYNGSFITRCALRLAPMIFQRPGQLRLAEWEDIRLEDELWRCPPEKMKLREWQKRDSRTPAHLVPLPRQAMEILRDLFPLTGPIGPVFRSMSRRSEKTRYISDNTINAALRSMGYDTKEQITGHGFRATARTMIREYLGWAPDVIERQLAHVSDEELGGSYDRTTFLVQRKTMVQQWADFLDDLEAGKGLLLRDNVQQFVRPPARPVHHAESERLGQ